MQPRDLVFRAAGDLVFFGFGLFNCSLADRGFFRIESGEFCFSRRQIRESFLLFFFGLDEFGSDYFPSCLEPFGEGRSNQINEGTYEQTEINKLPKFKPRIVEIVVKKTP
jgi:hypothetical protein